MYCRTYQTLDFNSQLCTKYSDIDSRQLQCMSWCQCPKPSGPSPKQLVVQCDHCWHLVLVSLHLLLGEPLVLLGAHWVTETLSHMHLINFLAHVRQAFCLFLFDHIHGWPHLWHLLHTLSISLTGISPGSCPLIIPKILWFSGHTPCS